MDIEEGDTNTCMAFQPSLFRRFLRKIGYKYGAYVERPEDDNASYIITRITAHWCLWDRVLLLFSGTTDIEVCVETDCEIVPKRTRAQSAVVLSARLKEPQS